MKTRYLKRARCGHVGLGERPGSHHQIVSFLVRGRLGDQCAIFVVTPKCYGPPSLGLLKMLRLFRKMVVGSRRSPVLKDVFQLHQMNLQLFVLQQTATHHLGWMTQADATAGSPTWGASYCAGCQIERGAAI